MTATVVALPIRARLACSKCGATGEGSCNCGAPYLPPGMRAAAAIAETPEKSDRAIAEDIGVSQPTVSRARKRSTDTDVSVEARTGRDGKKRKKREKPKPPQRPEPVITSPVDDVNAFHRETMKFLTDFTERFRAWYATKPLIDDDGKGALQQAFYLLADGFAHLAQEVDGR